MTPNEVLNKRFSKAAIGGYRAEDVHIFLANVSDYIEQVEKDRDDLERKLLFLAEKIEEYREDEESLRAALVNAQKTGEIVIQEAKDEANRLLTQSQEQAEILVTDARKQSDNLISSAKLKVDTEAYTLNRMEMEVSKFRGQLLNMYEKQIELINVIPFDDNITSPPLARPAGLSQEPSTVIETAVQLRDPDSEQAGEQAGMITTNKLVDETSSEKDSFEQKNHTEGFQLSDN